MATSQKGSSDTALWQGIALGLGFGVAAGVALRFMSKSEDKPIKATPPLRVPRSAVKTGEVQTQGVPNKTGGKDGVKWDAWDERDSVTVRVPATSANMGPGFDSIGVALDMWSEITVSRASKFKFTCEGEGADALPLDETNLVVQGVKKAFEYVGQELVPLRYHCKNNIPYGRGLGSSSAAIVGGLLAGLALCGKELRVYGQDSLYSGGTMAEPEELLQLACELEGHPDNAAPALYGGIQLGIKTTDGQWRSSRVNCPADLQMVAFIPDFVGVTAELRAVLKDNISRKDAIFNIGRSAFLVNALNSNKLYDLRYGTEDVLHQPQRAKSVYKHFYPILKGAMNAGAHAVYMSGAGPTVLAITSGAAGDTFTQHGSERMERSIADAMLSAAEKVDCKGSVYITRPVVHGAYILKAEPPFSQGMVRYPNSV